MIHTSNKSLHLKEKGAKYIFLAGSMDTSVKNNWRDDVVHVLGEVYNFYDPTNNNHDMLNDIEMREHIKWELDALNMSDKILLNFLPDAQSPISLVELGLYVSSNKLIVICPKEFHQSRYVRVLCKQYNTPLFNKMDDALRTLGNNSILL